MSTTDVTVQRYDTRGRAINANRKRRHGHAPRNKGKKYPPQALKPAEIQQLLKACAPDSKYAGRPVHLAAFRTRTLIVLLWRTGLRITEALELEERDLDPENQLITVRCGKGGKRRVVGMDPWGWKVLTAWLEYRKTLPPGKLLPILTGTTAGERWSSGDVRKHFYRAAVRGNLRVRCHPHALRHTFAVEAWREGIDVVSISRQLGHSRLDVTMIYLVSLGADELLEPVTKRKSPSVPLDLATASMPTLAVMQEMPIPVFALAA